MREIHFVNIGMAKSGTTALFKALSSHPMVDFNKDKENFYLPIIGYPISGYTDYYSDFNVSLNMAPSLWMLESKLINELKQIGTHFAIIF